MKTKKMRFDINTWLPIIIFVLIQCCNWRSIAEFKKYSEYL